jgi:hypothetical protein
MKIIQDVAQWPWSAIPQGGIFLLTANMHGHIMRTPYTSLLPKGTDIFRRCSLLNPIFFAIVQGLCFPYPHSRLSVFGAVPLF